MNNFTKEEFEMIYTGIYKYITSNNNNNLKREKKAYILGGQPGAGKSTFYKDNSDVENSIMINGDEYRKYHPRYNKIASEDIANMPVLTQAFTNSVVEHLINDLSDDGYNIIIEGTLRNPNVPIKTCQNLSSKGYETNLVVVAYDAVLSWESTIARADKMNKMGEYPRFVPINIYNETVSNIVKNLEIISDKKCFDTISVINRSGMVLYPKEFGLTPGKVLEQEIKLDKWNRSFDDLRKNFENRMLIYNSNNNQDEKKKIIKATSIKERIEQKKKIIGQQKTPPKPPRGGREEPERYRLG